MEITTIVGARPQFIKAAPVSSALAAAGLEESIIHTGQHYDFAMSELFFEQLGIPAPKQFLALGGGSHGEMTGAMLAAIEKQLMGSRPDAVLVYGDTNSTLAGGLAAAKLHIPVIHIEAGLRSFNRAMPEEINRVLTDHLSELLFCPSETAEHNLHAEGIREGIHVCGDVMAAATERAREALDDPGFAEAIGETLPELPAAFALMTLHRAENVDHPERLAAIFSAIGELARPVVLPLHPRTRGALERAGMPLPDNVVRLEPVGYFQMTALLSACELVLTDSGGLQKEAYWHGKRCVTLRDETEWVETVEAGWNAIVGAEPERILAACDLEPPTARPALYGDAGAPAKIAQITASALSA